MANNNSRLEPPAQWKIPIQDEDKRMGGADLVKHALTQDGVTRHPTAFSDEGILSFCLPIPILYRDSLLKEQILVTNGSAPSYTQVFPLADLGLQWGDPGDTPQQVCSAITRTLS